MSGIAYKTGDKCPKCKGHVEEIWNPATVQEPRGLFGQPRTVHKVIARLLCRQCGWQRLEDTLDTDKELAKLLPGKGARG